MQYLDFNNIVYCRYAIKPHFLSLYSCIRQYTRSLAALQLTSFLPVSLSLILVHNFIELRLAYIIARLRLACFYHQAFNSFYMNIELTKILHVHFYIVSKTEKKSPLPMMYIYSSFPPFILPPLVERYVNDVEKS